MKEDMVLPPELGFYTRPWFGLVDNCRYRHPGPVLDWVMRRVLRDAAAVTLAGVAYVREDCWREDVETAALLVHESVHARDQRDRGWLRFLTTYLWYWVRHRKDDPRSYPQEREAYRLGGEVRDYWAWR